MSVEAFRKASDTAKIRFSRDDEELNALIKTLWTESGVYCLEINSHTIRIGISGTGLGQRLRHHLKAAYGDSPSRSAQWPNHFQFHKRLIGHEFVVRYLVCSRTQSRLVERVLLAELGDGVLWEKLERRRRQGGPVDYGAVDALFRKA
jgi:hypothetical protein